MKTRLLSYSVVVMALLGVCFLVSMLAAQERAPISTATDSIGKTTTVPRTPSGHPDLSGFYLNDDRGHEVSREADGSILTLYGGAENRGVTGEPPLNPNRPPYKPEYMAKVQEIATHDYGGTSRLDPILDCKPQGIPRSALSGGLQIIQNDRYIGLIYENAPGPQFRIVYMDGRPHPNDLDTSFMGHSIGHWEGDTLVVDVVGLNDETWLAGMGGGQDRETTIHSDKEHVIERWTRKGDDLTYEATVEDPVMFTKPWVITPRKTRVAKADDYAQPQMCNTNDKAHIVTPSDKDRYTCNWCNPESLYDGSKANK